MKKILLCLSTLLYLAPAFSQTSGGPDAYGYTWRNSNDSAGPAYSWIDITTLPGATQVFGLTDDNTAGFFNIGFQFPFYWYAASQFKVGSNGYLIFDGSGGISSPFPNIPSPAIPQDFIGAFMSDHLFGGAGNPAQCWYWSNNTDTLILSYLNVPFWVAPPTNFTGSNTFQIILSAVDSSITFQYATQQGTSAALADFITIGIENNSGTIGLEQAKDFYPAEQYAIKFYYPGSSTFVVNDASTSYNTNPESAGLFLMSSSAPFTMSTRVKNTGNQSLAAFNVYMSVLNSSGAVQVAETLQTSALTPGQTEDLTATSTFSPTTPGTYRFITTTALPGDATPTNDMKMLEIDVVDTAAGGMITLSYTSDQNIPAGFGVSWSGGDAGAGEEFYPPFYPFYIEQLEFYIVDDPNAVGFHSVIYDNTGPNNGPGTLLDSVFIDPATILINQWNIVTLPVAIRVDSGSVFVGWLMGGESVLLGIDSTAPRCNRSFEILGSWAIYRDRENQDPMIRVNGNFYNVGISETLDESLVGEFYPSPSKGRVFINTDLKNQSDEISFSFYDIHGRVVETKSVSHSAGKQTYTFDLSKESAGIYTCRIVAGEKELNRKLVVTQ